MVDSVVHFYFGYAQIHEKGYWEEQSLDKAFPFPDTSLPSEVPGASIDLLVPRIESFALMSYGQNTKGVLLVGVDPDKEAKLTSLHSRIEQGAKEIVPGGAILASGLAEDMKIGIGDTVVFISQGYRGTNAAGKYPVSGIINFGSPELNDRMTYLPLADAQQFFRAEGLVTGLVVGISDRGQLPGAMKALESAIDTNKYEILDYEEMLPELMEAREFDEAGSVIILFILYSIITFGIFGTMLMMLKEREYEFGILKAIGMKSRQIIGVLWLEVLILSLLGALGGMLLALPLILYFKTHPIRFSGDMAAAYEKFGLEAMLPASLDLQIFLSQAIIVVILVTIMFIYPVLKIFKLKPMRALHH